MIKSISGDFQGLRKSFSRAAISTLLIHALLVLFVSFHLVLKDPKSVNVLFCTSLQYCHKISDVYE